MSRLDVVAFTAIPLCALDGDNVVQRSERMPWYEGPALLWHLEHLYVGGTVNHVDARQDGPYQAAITAVVLWKPSMLPPKRAISP